MTDRLGRHGTDGASTSVRDPPGLHGATTARVETWDLVDIELAQPGVERRGVGEQARVPDESGGAAR